MTAMERLLTFYNSVSDDSMQKVALKAILVNFKEIGELSIFDLAEICYTSPASISRLVRKMGYKNYAYFQKDIQDNVRRYDRHNRLVSPDSKPAEMEMSAFFLGTLEELYESYVRNIDYDKIHEVNRMMRGSRKTVLYTYFIFMAETFIQSDLFMSGIVCDIYHNEDRIFSNLDTLGSDDFVILISPLAEEGLQTARIIEGIHKAGAKVCLITGSQRTAEEENAEICFVLPGVNKAVDMFVMQVLLCLIDIEYRKLYLDQG